jgi:two-component system, chemotaxis family, protein-glutamate methylesterase/glutaminase
VYDSAHSDFIAEKEHPRNSPRAERAFEVVAIAGSTGAIEALKRLLAVLPKEFPAAVLVAQHLPPASHHKSLLDLVLSRSTRLQVKWAEEGERIRPGVVFLAPQDSHLLIDSAGALHLTAGPRVNRFRPAADPLFASVAEHFGPKSIGVVLSGALYDGAEGAWKIARSGGRVLTQDRTSCVCFDMPRATLAAAGADFTFSPPIIGHTLVNLAMVPGASDWLRVCRAIRPQFRAPARSASAPRSSGCPDLP